MLDHFNFKKFIGLRSDSSRVEKIFSLKVVYTCVHVFVLFVLEYLVALIHSLTFLFKHQIYLLSTYLLGAADPVVNKTKEHSGLLN